MGAKRRILLVLDDDPVVARGLGRVLRHHFDTVHVVNAVEDAEAVLTDSPDLVTHVVCDHFLGEAEPTGLSLLPRWRLRFPSIQVAVLVSGSELRALATTPGIDGYVEKPPDIATLRASLQLR